MSQCGPQFNLTSIICSIRWDGQKNVQKPCCLSQTNGCQATRSALIRTIYNTTCGVLMVLYMVAQLLLAKRLFISPHGCRYAFVEVRKNV